MSTINWSCYSNWQCTPEGRAHLRKLATGRGHTEETKQKLREINRNFVHRPATVILLSKINTGIQNPNWRGGKAYEPYPAEFYRESLKEKIRARDKYQCRLCGVPQTECLRALDVHHIDHDKDNLDEDNLISLCMCCNGKCNSSTFVPEFLSI